MIKMERCVLHSPQIETHILQTKLEGNKKATNIAIFAKQLREDAFAP